MSESNRTKIVVAVITAIAVVVAAIIGAPFVSDWLGQSTAEVSSVSIDSYDEMSKTVSGRAILSKDQPVWVLVYAGKAGGPYWLQGADGKRFSEDSRTQQGKDWTVVWTISEVHLGPDVVDLQAIAILPNERERFLAAGTPDPDSGNAIKIETLAELPEFEAISSGFNPNK